MKPVEYNQKTLRDLHDFDKAMKMILLYSIDLGLFLLLFYYYYYWIFWCLQSWIKKLYTFFW